MNGTKKGLSIGLLIFATMPASSIERERPTKNHHNHCVVRGA